MNIEFKKSVASQRDYNIFVNGKNVGYLSALGRDRRYAISLAGTRGYETERTLARAKKRATEMLKLSEGYSD